LEGAGEDVGGELLEVGGGDGVGWQDKVPRNLNRNTWRLGGDFLFWLTGQNRLNKRLMGKIV
jgi:hypothetical protein